MMRTITYLATLAVALNLALTAAWAQQFGPAAPITSPVPMGAPIGPAPSGLAGGYPVMPAGHLLSDGCDGCDGGGCGSCGGMGGHGRLLAGHGGLLAGHGGLLGGPQSLFCGFYGGTDYLLMWGKGRSTPPLATTSPPGTPRNEAGVLGFEDTRILFGGEPIGDGVGNGLRINLGAWFDPHESVGLATRLTGIQGDSPDFGQSSFERPILAVPFFNVQLGQEDALLASYPNQLEGSLNVDSELDMWAADVFLRTMVLRGSGYRVDFLGGYQYTLIDDGIDIRSVATSLPGNTTPGVADGTIFDTWDSFDARNQFHGGTLGLMTELYHGRWTLTTMGKIAIGNMHHEITIRGRDIITVPGQEPERRAGGLLTQPSNIGTYNEDQLAFVPEATISLSYALTANLKCTIGYNFIYWTRVALAGDHIDRAVNPVQEGGLPADRPAFPGIRDTDFWLMGGTFGLEGRF